MIGHADEGRVARRLGNQILGFLLDLIHWNNIALVDDQQQRLV